MRKNVVLVCLHVLFLGAVLSFTAEPVLAEPEGIYLCQSKTGELHATNTPKAPQFKGWKCRPAVVDHSPRASSRGGTRAKTRGKRKSKNRIKARPYRPPEGTDVKPMSKRTHARISQRILQYVREAAYKYQLPEDFILGVIYTESRFNPNATSRVGAMGLMQLMPGTAGDLGVQDAYDPYENVMGGTRLLRMLADKLNGDYVRVISAYHAGRGAVNRAGGIPFEKTDQYVLSVLDAYDGFKDGILTLPEFAQTPSEAAK